MKDQVCLHVLICHLLLKESQDIYHRKMDQVLEGFAGTIGVSDDICIYGKTIEEHD